MVRPKEFDAEVALDRALELDSGRLDLMVVVAQTKAQMGDSSGAWESFNQIVDLEDAGVPLDL